MWRSYEFHNKEFYLGQMYLKTIFTFRNQLHTSSYAYESWLRELIIIK